MIGSKEECLDRIAQYEKVGVTHFIFNLRWPILVEDEFQAFAEEVIPSADGRIHSYRAIATRV